MTALNSKCISVLSSKTRENCELQYCWSEHWTCHTIHCGNPDTEKTACSFTYIKHIRQMKLLPILSGCLIYWYSSWFYIVQKMWGNTQIGQMTSQNKCQGLFVPSVHSGCRVLSCPVPSVRPSSKHIYNWLKWLRLLLPKLVTFGHRLPKLVDNISSQIHHLVNTGLAVGSLVKWLPI